MRTICTCGNRKATPGELLGACLWLGFGAVLAGVLLGATAWIAVTTYLTLQTWSL